MKIGAPKQSMIVLLVQESTSSFPNRDTVRTRRVANPNPSIFDHAEQYLESNPEEDMKFGFICNNPWQIQCNKGQ